MATEASFAGCAFDLAKQAAFLARHTALTRGEAPWVAGLRGPSFTAGSGLEPGVLSAVVVAVLAMTALTWAAWAIQFQWTALFQRRVRFGFGGFLCLVVRVAVVLSLLLFVVLL